MAVSPNLRILLPETGASDNVRVISEALVRLDQALGGSFVHDFTSDADFVFPIEGEDHFNFYWRINDSLTTLTTARSMIIPPNIAGLHLVINNTAQTINVQYPTGANAAVLSATMTKVFANKTEVFIVS